MHEIIERSDKDNIESRPVWKPMHLQPLFDEITYYPHGKENSISDILFRYGICLPSGTNMTEREQEKVIDIITKMIK